MGGQGRGAKAAHSHLCSRSGAQNTGVKRTPKSQRRKTRRGSLQQSAFRSEKPCVTRHTTTRPLTGGQLPSIRICQSCMVVISGRNDNRLALAGSFDKQDLRRGHVMMREQSPLWWAPKLDSRVAKASNQGGRAAGRGGRARSGSMGAQHGISKNPILCQQQIRSRSLNPCFTMGPWYGTYRLAAPRLLMLGFWTVWPRFCHRKRRSCQLSCIFPNSCCPAAAKTCRGEGELGSRCTGYTQQGSVSQYSPFR